MAKKKGVGIQLLGRTANGLVAILQVRSWWNLEKNAPESWPGGCQVTAHGGLKDREKFFWALLREVAEELGDKIASTIRELPLRRLKELVNLDTPEKHIVTYGAVVELEVCLELLGRPKSDSFGGFKIIRRDEVDEIVDLRKFDKTTGVTDGNIVAMFPDEIKAVRLAFERFG